MANIWWYVVIICAFMFLFHALPINGAALEPLAMTRPIAGYSVLFIFYSVSVYCGLRAARLAVGPLGI